MSTPDMVEQLEALENIRIKGSLSIEDLVRRQIDRCNMSISSADPEVFNSNVRALMKHLPGKKYDVIMGNSTDYNTTHESYVFKNTCGHDIGTVKNPFVTVPGHPEWEFFLDIPKPYRKRYKDEISIISPVKVEETTTDYEKLYRIVLEAFESQGLTWRVEGRTVEMGKKDKDPKSYDYLVREIRDSIIGILTEAREDIEELNDVSYNQIIEQLRELTPPTPVM